VSEELVPYYGRLDYPSVLLTQLVRISAVRSSLSYPVSSIDLFRYWSAVLVLYMLSPPSVRKRVGEPPRTSVEELDAYLVRLRDALEYEGLIGTRFIERGRPEVGFNADLHEEGD